MVSSFFGLYTAQRALSTNQTMLNIVSNNISNANTEGYSRQIASLVTSSPFPQPMVGSVSLPGTIGTGVEIQTITRSRDSFMDAQFRLENSTLGFFDEKEYALQFTEGVLNEPSDAGLSQKMISFFDSAQLLSMNPESLPVRTSFVQQSIDLSTVLNQQNNSLSQLRKNLVGDATNANSLINSRLGVDIADVNSKLNNLANINREIITMKGNGVEPNDLLDKRDFILDQLSDYLPLTFDIKDVESVNVFLGANPLVVGGNVINELSADAGDNNTDPTFVALYSPAGALNVANVNNLITNGKMGALLELGGHDPSALSIRNLMDDLDTVAQTLATRVNDLQNAGRYIFVDNAAIPPTRELRDAGPDFPVIFESSDANPLDASNISVTQDLVDDPYRVAAALLTANNEELGSAGQALQIAQLRDSETLGPNGATFTNFHSSVISILGVQAKSNKDNLDAQESLVGQIELRRQSVSGVNLDEELIDLIRFQRAFESSSRVVATMNEVIEVIINRMQ